MTERLRRGSRLPWIGMGAAVAVAAALGGAAYWNQRQAARAERRYPPVGQFVEMDGVRVHYLEKGEGAPVVLIHGNGSQSGDFVASGLFDLLSRRHRVIAFDRPGFGFSERPNDRLWTAAAQARLLAGAMDALDIDDAVIVGHSFGATVAAAMALDTPESVRALVLLGGYYYPSARAETLLGLQAVPLLGPLIAHSITPLVTRALARPVARRMFAPHAIAPRYESLVPRGLRARPTQVDAASSDSALMVPAAFRMRRRYWQIQQPTTIFTGDADRVVDPGRQSLRLHRDILQSELRVLPRVGHMIHYSAARKIAAVVGHYAST